MKAPSYGPKFKCRHAAWTSWILSYPINPHTPFRTRLDPFFSVSQFVKSLFVMIWSWRWKMANASLLMELQVPLWETGFPGRHWFKHKNFSSNDNKTTFLKWEKAEQVGSYSIRELGASTSPYVISLCTTWAGWNSGEQTLLLMTVAGEKGEVLQEDWNVDFVWVCHGVHSACSGDTLWPASNCWLSLGLQEDPIRWLVHESLWTLPVTPTTSKLRKDI